jgi:membrane protease subunit (stomatin/prohibitin family)
MIVNEVMKDVKSLIEKVKEVIQEQYKEYKITVTGIHIEKIAGKDEYAITVNFNASREVKEGTIVIEQKLVFFNGTYKFTLAYKYLL